MQAEVGGKVAFVRRDCQIEAQLGLCAHGKPVLSASFLHNTLGQRGSGKWRWRMAGELQLCLLGDDRPCFCMGDKASDQSRVQELIMTRDEQLMGPKTHQHSGHS